MSRTPKLTPAHKWVLCAGLGSAAVLCVALLDVTGLWGPGWRGELSDPDVRAIYLPCGVDNEPSGAGMPAWPDENAQKAYVKQLWSDNGDLKVEVWEFGSPGYVLTKAQRDVKGAEIHITVEWDVPPGGAVAACKSKLGAELTFRGLPRQSYTVIAK